MRQATKFWPALAALGAGLVHLATGAAAPMPALMLLVGLGLAELGWGIAVLAVGRILVPRAVLIGSTGALLLSGILIGLGGIVPLIPLVSGCVFLLYLAAMAGTHERHLVESSRESGLAPSDESTTSAPALSTGWKPLVGLLIGAALVSGIATPAMASTEAGKFAVVHGESGHHH